jgi:thiol-disulfide isomerase/thioredoxin
MNLKQKVKAYFKKKSFWGKISDFIFIGLIIALLIPGSRLAIGGFVNRIKAMIVQPSVESAENQERMSDQDYNWPITDMDGIELSLNDFKGKVIFLNFWATWCPPCVGEMPEIQALYDMYKDRPQVQFLLVSNEDHQTVKNFIQKRGFSFPVFSSRFNAPKIFYSESIPTSFLISKDGRLVIRETGASRWSGKKMQDIINDLIKE